MIEVFRETLKLTNTVNVTPNISFKYHYRNLVCVEWEEIK